ncbi:MAG: hypothetical protein MUE40_01340 [Anaerolineae bacterium]|jgi:hypothetical protein|nr:hypothetical protein [Anaerolineae bacterium]
MSRDYRDDNLKEAALGIYTHVARMMKEGKSDSDIEQALAQHGINAATTRMMLSKLAQSQVNVARRSGRRNIALGLVLIGPGLLLIGGQPQGAGAVFAWLSVVVGAFWVMRGAVQLTAARNYERQP